MSLCAVTAAGAAVYLVFPLKSRGSSLRDLLLINGGDDVNVSPVIFFFSRTFCYDTTKGGRRSQMKKCSHACHLCFRLLLSAILGDIMEAPALFQRHQ